MEKAYNPKALLSKLKQRGLDLGEEAAVIMIEEVSDWVVESAAVSKTPFDDIAAVVMPQLKKFAIDQADKIDGEDDRP